jgi:MFS family permease
MNPPAAVPPTESSSFAALSHPGYRWHFCTYVLAMMADNIEHVISYWMMYQKFHSPALGGFAVVSHWLPFLLFSVPVGALAERVDTRRIIQASMAIFIIVSLAWGYFIFTDTLQMWHAMVLLILHGCAGALWQTSSQMLLHDIVPSKDMPSAVRLNATARYLGVLVGPAVGGLLMLVLTPAQSIFLNAVIYLPLVFWLWKAPYGSKFRAPHQKLQRAVRGMRDIVQGLRDIKQQPTIISMTLLAGAASFFVGNSYHAQMPIFATDLGLGDPGTAYSFLLAADAAGALVAGVILESTRLFKSNARTALLLALAWCLALCGFALTRNYLLALALLFVAGFFELSFSSMSQAIVQINAPAEIRGRVIGLFNMSSLGMRSFSGLTVGFAGAWAGVHYSLAASALLLTALILWLFRRA